MAEKHHLLGSWTNRRRYLYLVSAFTMVMMAGGLVYRPDASVTRVVIEMGFIALISFVGTYVFGAAWDDHNQRKINASANVSFSAGAGASRDQG